MTTTANPDQLLASLDRLAAAHRSLTGSRDSVSRRTAAQIEQTATLIRLAIDHFALTNQELAAALSEIGLLRQQQREFLESQPSYVLTDERGVIHDANTPALLLLGASVADVGLVTVDRFLDGVECVLAGLARGEGVQTAPVRLRSQTRPRVLTVRVRRAGRSAPLWHWLFS